MSDHAEVMEGFYMDSVAHTAQRLRDTADRMEREGRVIPGGTFTGAARRVMHEFLWGIANANADGIVGAAEEADEALRKGERES